MSTCHLVVSSCLLVTSTCRPVASSSQIVVLTRDLLAPACRFVVLSFSTRRFFVSICHLVVSTCRPVECRPLNSSCRLFNSSSRRVNSSLLAAILNTEKTLGQRKQTAQAQAPTCECPCECKMDELNAVKDILRDALSRIDQIPPQNSQNQNTSQSNQDHELPPSSNNTNVGLLARAQSNFR